MIEIVKRNMLDIGESKYDRRRNDEENQRIIP